MRDISKLPKYAQEIITKQQQRIATLESDKEGLVQEQRDVELGKTPVSYTLDWKTKHHLPKRVLVTFCIDGQDIDVCLEGDGISVRTDRTMKVTPQASNLIWVKSE